MTIDVCCLVFTLLSANVSDLAQTARFTHQDGRDEQNLLAAWLVDGPSPSGEIVSGIAAVVMATWLTRRDDTAARVAMLAWASAHIRAVQQNARFNNETVYRVVFPGIMIAW